MNEPTSDLDSATVKMLCKLLKNFVDFPSVFCADQWYEVEHLCNNSEDQDLVISYIHALHLGVELELFITRRSDGKFRLMPSDPDDLK
mgnify:CR=1 FL=1